jgi:hypothetical protein
MVISSSERSAGLGERMPHDELVALLARAREVLERYLLEPDGEMTRDDIAEVCMAIDDALPEQGQLRLRSAEPERSAA